MRKNGIKIVQASSERDYKAAKGLFREYEIYLNLDLSFQDFETDPHQVQILLNWWPNS